MSTSGPQPASLLECVDARVVVSDTADGFVLRLLAGLGGHDLGALGVSPVTHQQLVTSLAESRAACHSGAGIYLAVKAVPAAEQPALLSGLAPGDEGHFDLFADVLDEVCGASQLQRLVALHAARLAFSSPLAERLAEAADAPSDLEDVLPLDSLERPDIRIRRLLDGVVDSPAPLADVLARRHQVVAAQVGVPAWDLNDEPSWRRNQAAHPEAVKVVEAELAHVLRPWLVHASDLPCLLDDALAEVRDRLAAWADRAVSVPLLPR